MSTASFHSLFRRSRYERDDDMEAHEAKQCRKELFAVAAVGFMLRHSESFRRRFARLTPSRRSLASGEIDIEIQKHDFCDLLITNRRRSFACVVEFKVESELMDHQNPEKPAFRRAAKGAKTGYGRDMVSHLGTEIRQFEYVLVANLRQFDNCNVRIGERVIQCRAMAWGELARSGRPEEPLEADLFDSLGNLGIRAFAQRNLKMKNILEHTRGAVAIYSTVETVAGKLGIKGRSFKLDVQSNADGCWFGANLPRKWKSFAGLEKLTAPTGAPGWFGYEWKQGKPQLGVWLYSDAERQDRLATYIREKSGFAWRNEKMDFFHRGKAMTGQTDEEWFLKVIERLKDGVRI